MTATLLRRSTDQDLPALTAIYNHYVEHTPITFDKEPWTVERRATWFSGFADQGRHQLFVAEHQGRVVGYGGSGRFRVKAAYDTTVETSVYLDPEFTGQGLGTRLYTRLFEALQGSGAHRALAGITLPNEASMRLHERFGFTDCGVLHQVGNKFDKFWDVQWLERAVEARD